jgi:phosphoribosyl 1,2-cyclic phosphodiesterase
MKPETHIAVSVRFWGVRGSIPAPDAANLRYGGNTSCLEVRCNDELIILDAGSGLRSLGLELERRAQGHPIEGSVFLSHTHWDHIQGLPFFAPGYRAENRFRLFVGPGRADRILQGLRDQMSPLHFPVRFEDMAGLRPVEELGALHNTLGSFAVATFPLNHPGGCTGFRLEAHGKSIAYLPDHEPFGAATPQALAGQRALEEFMKDVDLLVLDTQYTAEEYTARRGWGHGSLPESVDLAVAAKVRELVLFHHDPSHHDGQIDAMLAMARQRASGTRLMIIAAQEGETIDLQAPVMSESACKPLSAPHSESVPV